MLVLLLVEFRVLQVLQEFQVPRLVSSGDSLDVEVGPLVETGLNRQASSGRWKSCLSCLRVAK